MLVAWRREEGRRALQCVNKSVTLEKGRQEAII